ncbi:MAG TPA: ABC-type transport auxiliary lipoprotein family protein [Rhodanobacteraceae bacterium]|nr:ABC-type transport auxiliary lipoprotein family protein [Rhodanobacteraceae bacterium]
MKRIRVLLVTCLLMLGGCGAASRQNVVLRHYTLGAWPAVATTSPHAKGAVLRIARIEMPAWLQGTGLYYRLAYRNGNVIAAYANSDWAAPPASMLEQRLRATFADDGGWRAVVGPASNAQADFTLHVSVDDFSQVFTAPGESSGVLDATATLDGADDALVAQRHFRFSAAAPTPDADGGVKALDAASRDFARQLREWLAAQQPNHS